MKFNVIIQDEINKLGEKLTNKDITPITSATYACEREKIADIYGNHESYCNTAYVRDVKLQIVANFEELPITHGRCINGWCI